MTKKIRLKSIDDVRRFNAICSKEQFDIDVVCGRYVIDAKSLLGLFSLDLTKELSVVVYVLNECDAESFVQQIEKWMVKE